MTDSHNRYFARPAGIPGRFVLWDRRCNSAVYGMELAAARSAVEARAQRLNNVYSQFIEDRGRDASRRPVSTSF